MPYKYDRLRGRIVEKYGSQSKFSLVLGTSKTIVSRKMTCNSGFSQSDIDTWSKLLDINPDEYGEYFFT